jgi:hypothetical protein
VFERERFDDVVTGNAKDAKSLMENAKTIVIKTADKFSYTLKVAVKDDKGYMKYSVSADIPEKMEADKNAAFDEKEKEKRLKRFQERRKKLLAKLEKEKKLSKWIYVYPKYVVEKVLKKRSDFVVKKENKEEGKKQDGKKDGKKD